MIMQFSVIFVSQLSGHQITPKDGTVIFDQEGAVIEDEHGKRFKILCTRNRAFVEREVLWRQTEVVCKEM